MYSYIITTDDISAANEKIEEIKKSISGEFDEITYDLSEDGVYSLIDELTTVSLFDTPKFILVKSPDELSQASEKGVIDLCAAMHDPDSQNVLIYIFTKNPDFKNEKLARIKKYASTIDVRIKNIPMDQYALRVFTENGYTIPEQTLSLLVSYVDSLSSLQRAIEILILYCEEKKKITSDDVELMVAKPLDDNVYQLVDAVLSHHTKEVFAIYKDLKIINVQPSFLVSLLVNKFQEMYNVSVLVKSNMTQADIASIFNVSSGRAYYMVKNAKSSNLPKIKENLQYLNQLDLDIKSGKIDQTLGLELFFLR